MTFDLAVPENLKDVQKWFASIITRPIDEYNQMDPTSPTGRPMAQEASDYINPSPTLQPAQRIELYNQQYWWRLLALMQETYPLVTRLFGYHDFNQKISIPYLVKYPPNHWSLNLLGDRLSKWVEEEYTADDKPLISHCVKFDWAFNHSFVAPQNEGIDVDQLPVPGDLSSILDRTLYMQPHVFLFDFPYDLVHFREEFLKQPPEYWVEHDFPKLVRQADSEPFYFLFFRNRHNNLQIEKIDQSEYLLLKHFEKGISIDDLCQWLEEQPPESKVVIESSQHLHVWIQRWFANLLLSLSREGGVSM